MTGTVYRWRSCPSCHRTAPAGEYSVHPDDRDGARWGHRDAARRVCPSCTRVAPTSCFPLAPSSAPYALPPLPSWTPPTFDPLPEQLDLFGPSASGAGRWSTAP